HEDCAYDDELPPVSANRCKRVEVRRRLQVSRHVPPPLEPESEVCTVDQEATSVSRFSMTPIIVSLAKPTAIMTRASYWAIRRRLRRSQENVRSITQRRRKILKPPSLSVRLTISSSRGSPTSWLASLGPA